MSASDLEGDGAVLTYPELARLAVVTAAPDELELLPDATSAWRDAASGGRSGERTGSSIGFGLDPHTLVDVVFQILIGTVAEILGSAAGRRLRGRQDGAKEAVPALTVEQAARVREICLTQALNAGVKPPKAALVADAVSGALLLQARGEHPG